eukprot:scaffold7807_cov95-Skeletonema_dohrnii-CCMP3373.AAC.3
MNPNNDFDVNAQGVEVMANNGDLPSVSFDQDGIQVTNTELPFGGDDAKAEEYNSPKRRRDQVATIASFFGISSCTRNKKFLIGGIGSAALLALVWSVPSMKESHVNKNSAAVRKPALAKSSKVPFAKVTKAKASKAKASGSDRPSLSLGPSFAPSESDGPTLGPSLTPSASGGPTLGPSLTPSESDGPTLEPSSSPDPISLYGFVGEGYCADSQAPQTSDIFPYVSFGGSAASSPSACASKCTGCVRVNGAVSAGSFRGFTLDSDCLYCLCHVDDGSVYNPGAGGAGCAGTISDGGVGFAGRGEIPGVYVTPTDHVCFKYKLPDLDSFVCSQMIWSSLPLPTHLSKASGAGAGEWSCDCEDEGINGIDRYCYLMTMTAIIYCLHNQCPASLAALVSSQLSALPRKVHIYVYVQSLATTAIPQFLQIISLIFHHLAC